MRPIQDKYRFFQCFNDQIFQTIKGLQFSRSKKHYFFKTVAIIIKKQARVSRWAALRV